MNAKKQVVSGIMHHLSIEVKEGAEKKLYEAKIWVQEWLNSKKLHDFKQMGTTPTDTSFLVFLTIRVRIKKGFLF